MRSSRRCLPKERGLQSAGRRHCVQAAKEMDSKCSGLCPQEFESPRCRLQGWREAKENSWRLVALRQRKWEQKKCGSLEPSPRTTVKHEKSCGVLERQHPLWDSSPRSSDSKSDALSIRPRGPVLMGQAKLRNLCGTGRDPLWLKARKSSKTCL